MRPLTPTEKLESAIAILEARQSNQWQEIRCQFDSVIETTKPINIIKNTLKDFSTIPNAKKSILGPITGIVAGYVSRKIVVADNSTSTLKKISGYVLQMAVTKLISKQVN
ncbi:hypothetical protein WFZ85_10850 [Flavobacterium sp. j3]|uniref:EcsC protein family protein n=1 Tax=Flavobacterium aureirubrum TaxID=3133147 RepID=A0ABU9N5X5_9FLAO